MNNVINWARMKLFNWQVNVKLIVSLFFLFSIQPLSANDGPTKIRLVTDSNYAPFSFLENDELKGEFIDLISRVDKELPDYNIELVPMPWKKGLDSIQKGQYLGIVGTYQFGERRPYLYPYSAPLYTEHVVALCRNGSDLPDGASWPQSFKGKLVLNIAGYDGWLGFYPRNDVRTQSINFLEVPSVSLAALMLKKGNADCTLSEKGFARNIVKMAQTNSEYNPRIAAEVVSNTVHVGYSVAAWQKQEHDHALQFAKAFDFALMSLQREGKLNLQ